MTYTYDTQGNLITATDGTGVTTLTYDTGDRLASVTYPNGQSLNYTYDTVGRRSQMVVKQGSSVTQTVNYTYNTLGQLTKLTDGSNNLIVSYTYNNVGELAREDKADGTYSTDTYDADGHLLDLINYAANGSIDSSFTYTYNALGQERPWRRTTEPGRTATTMPASWCTRPSARPIPVFPARTSVIPITQPAISPRRL